MTNGKAEKTTYQEGDIFVVPLDDGRQVLGVVARRGRNKTRDFVLGYFFKQGLDESPSLKAANSILAIQFGNLCLKNKKWPIIGKVDPWIREEWPIPKFYRDSFREFGGANFFQHIHYDDELNEVGEQRIPIAQNEEIQGYSRDAFYDALAVEIRLAELLA